MIIFLSYVLGAQKNRLTETIHLSTHHTCFIWKIIKIIKKNQLRSPTWRPGTVNKVFHNLYHLWSDAGERGQTVTWSIRGKQRLLNLLNLDFKYEPVHEISNNVICATSKASDQPAHMRSLIRAVASRLSILWLLSYWLNTVWSF